MEKFENSLPNSIRNTIDVFMSFILTKNYSVSFLVLTVVVLSSVIAEKGNWETCSAEGECTTMGRKVKRIFENVEQGEGDGARVRRSLGRKEVTYVLTGAVEHEDFVGHKGIIQEGDLQWMTAGRGVVHSEMPHPEVTGLQLWVNLAAKDKMVPPAYQELKKKDIPIGKNAEGTVEVTVIAGEALGAKSEVRTRTPTTYLDFRLKPGAKPITQPIGNGWNAFAVIVQGTVTFNEKDKASKHHTVLFEQDGPDGITFSNPSDSDAHFVLMSGQPLNEPVTQYGPFVMNSMEEIEKTFEDYQEGKNGFENAPLWKSSNKH